MLTFSLILIATLSFFSGEIDSALAFEIENVKTAEIIKNRTKEYLLIIFCRLRFNLKYTYWYMPNGLKYNILYCVFVYSFCIMPNTKRMGKDTFFLIIVKKMLKSFEKMAVIGV